MASRIRKFLRTVTELKVATKPPCMLTGNLLQRTRAQSGWGPSLAAQATLAAGTCEPSARLEAHRGSNSSREACLGQRAH